ncbi:MAG: hypothetical protein ACI9FG_001209 [Crocinitomicaceae bacterium]|jgi:hypothetical protein
MFISAEDIKVEGDEKCQNEFISALDVSADEPWRGLRT